MPKLLLAGEAHGIVFDKPKPIEAGETYGHLEVIEEVEKRGRDRRWRCRCLNVPDKAAGRMCGNLTIMRQTELRMVTKFRACKACIEVFTRRQRGRWGRGGSV